ncbi:MAG: isoprenylcysteine carboxylmethyltransferase family protein [Pseudomonadota bacterium]|nr:isoprenylcysteine carboxylmethyltransferase family protein [Pseudomonadota bacterium]
MPSFTQEPYNLLLAASEAFTVLLVLIRKPGQMASTPHVWAVAVVGTCAPLFVMPEGAIIISPAIGASFMCAGLLLSLSAKLFLNRSFGIVAANRGVKSRGPYRLVRHPMYLGYFITQTSFLLLSMSIWNVAVYGIGWIALLLRMDAEEAFLSRDAQYRDYAESVRYRLIPGIC